MGRNKAVGLDKILIEAWKCLGGEGVRWLTLFFNKTFLRAKMPEEWRHSKPYLFALILDGLSIRIQESIPWCLIFTDDTVLVLDTLEGINGILKQWRETLEDKGLRVSREKTEYLRCDFNRNENDQNEEAKIRIGWLKWRAATGVLCDKNVLLNLKRKFYRVAIRPAMLYESECWPLTKVQANRMEVVEMRMLRWTCGKTILDMILNGAFRRDLQVATIVNKMREGVKRMGRPKLRWEDRLKTDLKELLLSEDMTSNRNSWRTRIRVDEVFLKAVPLPSGRRVTVYILPPPYLAYAGLGTVVVVAYKYVGTKNNAKRVRLKLEKQGIKGPSPSFMHGNTPEIKIICLRHAAKAAVDGVDGVISHDWATKVFPHFYQWAIQYGIVSVNLFF
nr:hypothetical protein [Tanacetum cinerariifolium]